MERKEARGVDGLFPITFGIRVFDPREIIEIGSLKVI